MAGYLYCGLECVTFESGVDHHGAPIDGFDPITARAFAHMEEQDRRLPADIREAEALLDSIEGSGYDEQLRAVCEDLFEQAQENQD